jgi:RNA 3'-terminal phosphate cyclase (ATP)
VRQNEGPGNALMATLVHEHVTEVATVFGEKGISAERVANDLVRAVRHHQLSDAALGQHLADQWMLPLALAVSTRGGEASFSCTELTQHASTNIGVIERFLPVRFGVDQTAATTMVKVVRDPKC